ncbi:response regulator [Candidiatus Paracoxiella cheracis]|uniref:response regulator n=1 Tax=Candidiatus Paracoxiella cheracis TaxID=3405120 RepID=UPI003BF4B467
MIRVLLIEDHEIVRQGLNVLLAKARGIEVIGEATTGQEGLKLLKDKRPNVVVLDFRLPDSDGLVLVQKLVRFDPDIKILILTAMVNEHLAQRLLAAGAHGFLTKTHSITELESALRRVHSGQRYLSPDMAQQLALQRVRPQQPRNPFDILSKREMQIVLLIAQGLKPKAIAKQLFISPKTVNAYRYRLYDKLKVNTDVALISLAIKHGLVEVDKAT